MIARRRYLAFALLAAVLASLSSGAAAPARKGKPLIADAGDSAFISVGDPHVLGGMAWGGKTPYRYTWSFRGDASRFAYPKASNTMFKTDGLKPGDYDLDLTVRDASGATARDSVRIRLFSLEPVPILEEEVDVGPGVPDELFSDPNPESGGLDGQTKAFPFTVESSIRRLELELSWGTYVNPTETVIPGCLLLCAHDFDMYIEGPDPAYAAITSGASADHPEKIAIDNPKPGAYRAIVAAFLNVPDTYKLTVSVVKEPPGNPLPLIEVPATMRFVAGKKHSIKAKVAGTRDVRWDLNFDGVFEQKGTSVTGHVPRGTSLVTVKATRAGFELRRTIGVTVASADEIANNTTPFVIIGMGDSGINPYHEEFSAKTYPDPEVLRITRNFTRHPSEYIPGYPKNTPALPVTLGKDYLPPEDEELWTRDRIEFQKMYWIPGSKIVGAIDWTDSSGLNAADDIAPILDEDGHGTQSAGTAIGNRFGYCPACLIVFAEGLQGDEFLIQQPWIDIVSMSVGTAGNIGFGIIDSDASKVAAERGQTVIFAAGNGFGNAFDVPMSTYTSASAGPDWHVVVGAARTDNRRPIFGDANPVDISSWGDGTVPTACVTGTVGMCNHSGTSSATPLTSGVFGQVLREVRRALGDTSMGQRPRQVVATGTPVNASSFLRDGALTRAELWDIVFHTAEPFGTSGVPIPPYTFTWPGPDSTDYIAGGYGLATPKSAVQAIDVALGKAPKPERPAEDSFFATDAQIRRALWGDWDDGTGAAASGSSASPLGMLQLGNVKLDDVSSAGKLVSTLYQSQAASVRAAAAGNPLTYYMHHLGGCPEVALPNIPAVGTPLGHDTGTMYMDRVDSAGDDEPCGNPRITTVAAYYRPVGSWASGEPVGQALPIGSKIDATVFVTLEHPMLLQLTGYLLADGREVGAGVSPLTPVVDLLAARCRTDIEGCWTEVPISFETTRPVGADEVLAFQVAVRTSESTYFGYEGAHASKMSITPAPGAGAAGLLATITSIQNGARMKAGTARISGTARFGSAEGESLRKVLVSIDDPSFGRPISAASSDGFAHWTATLDLPPGQHVLYVRARQDRLISQADVVSFFVGGAGISKPAPSDDLPATGVPGQGPFGVALLSLAGCAALALGRPTRHGNPS